MKNINNIDEKRTVFSYEEIENRDFYVDWSRKEDFTKVLYIKNNEVIKEEVMLRNELSVLDYISIISFTLFMIISIYGKSIAEKIIN